MINPDQFLKFSCCGVFQALTFGHYPPAARSGQQAYSDHHKHSTIQIHQQVQPPQPGNYHNTLSFSVHVSGNKLQNDKEDNPIVSPYFFVLYM